MGSSGSAEKKEEFNEIKSIERQSEKHQQHIIQKEELPLELILLSLVKIKEIKSFLQECSSEIKKKKM